MGLPTSPVGTTNCMHMTTLIASFQWLAIVSTRCVVHTSSAHQTPLCVSSKYPQKQALLSNSVVRPLVTHRTHLRMCFELWALRHTITRPFRLCMSSAHQRARCSTDKMDKSGLNPTCLVATLVAHQIDLMSANRHNEHLLTIYLRPCQLSNVLSNI